MLSWRFSSSERFASLPEECSQLYLAIENRLSAVICIEDPVRDEAADIGVAINDGAQIAREIADVTIGADNLMGMVTFKKLSNGLMKRIHRNYRTIVGFNSGLIVLGVFGVIAPTTSALLHNTSTLLIGLQSMKDII